MTFSMNYNCCHAICLHYFLKTVYRKRIFCMFHHLLFISWYNDFYTVFIHYYLQSDMIMLCIDMPRCKQLIDVLTETPKRIYYVHFTSHISSALIIVGEGVMAVSHIYVLLPLLSKCNLRQICADGYLPWDEIRTQLFDHFLILWKYFVHGCII